MRTRAYTSMRFVYAVAIWIGLEIATEITG